MLSTSDRAIAEHFKRLLVERGLPVRRFVVFGSRARGDAEADSDLDVLVVMAQRDMAILDAIEECAWEAEFEPGLVIQPVVMTTDEVEHGPQKSSLLMLAVEQEGIAV